MRNCLSFLIVIGAVFLVSCSGNQEKTNAFKQGLEQVRVDFRTKAAAVTSREEYQAAVAAQEQATRDLMATYETLSGDEAELLRIQASMDIKDFSGAEERIEQLLNSDTGLINQVKLEKVSLLTSREEFGAATELFKTIEGSFPVNDKVMETWLNLSFYAPEAADRERYGRLFLDAENLPDHLARYTSYVVQAMAFAKKDAGDLDGARQMLKDAIAAEQDERTREGLAAELKVLDMIGQPATELEAPTWFNGKALKLASLKGKVVLVDFWATWCPPCRQVIPTLVETYNEMKDQGLVVIGYTKLYGTYRDDETNEGKVEPEKELELTKAFLDRFAITYPIAVSDNDEGFGAYGVRSIPTLFFIDRNGLIVDAEKGSESAGTLKEKVAGLLAR